MAQSPASVGDATVDIGPYDPFDFDPCACTQENRADESTQDNSAAEGECRS
jgi:hypothetical protein